MVETIIANLAFALRAYRNTEPERLSLNACVRGAIERLDAFITEAAMRVVKGKDHVLTVMTVCEGEQVSVRIGGAEVVFPRGDV